MRVLIAIFFACAGLLAMPAAWSEETAGQAAGQPVAPLKVGVRDVPPFAFRNGEQSWSGISADLWKLIAEQAGWQLEWVRLPSVQAQVDGLAAGEIDVAVGAMSMTPEREVRINFSHGFFTTNLAIATTRRESGWLVLLEQLLSPAFLKAVGALVFLLFIVGFVIWLLERRANAGQFGGGALNGLGNGFWWSAVTMTTVGYGDKAPVTLSGRFVATIWMFVSVITISGFTAAIASSVTLDSNQSRVGSVQDLHKVNVFTVPGSTAATLLSELGIRTRDVRDAGAALDLLADRRADAFVFDQAVLQYLRNQRGLDLEIIPIPRTAQTYAFGLRRDFRQSEELNRQLLTVLHSDRWNQLLVRYLGTR